MIGTQLSGAEELQDLEWFKIESMRLIEENADAEYGICGNEWCVIEKLRDAEETGKTGEILSALRGCACEHVAEIAGSVTGMA